MNPILKRQSLSFLDECRLTIPSFVALGMGAAYFFPMVSAYELTPSDPQKAIGYFFIAAASALIALLAGSGVFCGLSALRPPLVGARMLPLLFVAFVLIGFAAFLFISLPAK